MSLFKVTKPSGSIALIESSHVAVISITDPFGEIGQCPKSTFIAGAGFCVTCVESIDKVAELFAAAQRQK